MRDRHGAGTALSVRAQLGTGRRSARERHVRRAAESVIVNKPPPQAQSSGRAQFQHSFSDTLTLELGIKLVRERTKPKHLLTSVSRRQRKDAKFAQA